MDFLSLKEFLYILYSLFGDNIHSCSSDHNLLLDTRPQLTKFDDLFRFMHEFKNHSIDQYVNIEHKTEIALADFSLFIDIGFYGHSIDYVISKFSLARFDEDTIDDNVKWFVSDHLHDLYSRSIGCVTINMLPSRFCFSDRVKPGQPFQFKDFLFPKIRQRGYTQKNSELSELKFKGYNKLNGVNYCSMVEFATSEFVRYLLMSRKSKPSSSSWRKESILILDRMLNETKISVELVNVYISSMQEYSNLLK